MARPVPEAPLTAAAVAALARDPAARREYSALTPPFCLRAAADAGLTPPVREWLAALPCPTLAIGAGPLAAVCDVAVATATQAEALAARIATAPLAATALVQVLRATDGLPLEPALTLESLAYATLQAGAEFRRWRAAHIRHPLPATTGPAVEMVRTDDQLTLTLNRPATRNAMTVELRDALVEALELVLGDATLRHITLRAHGKCFSTGGALDEFGTAPDAATAHAVRSLTLPGRLLAACASRVTAHVHGACIGSGIEFPAFARRVVATPDAWFQLPELRYGLIPGAGGCVGIARRIGRQRTAWLVLSGQRIDARTARDWGLIDTIAIP